MRKDEDLIIDDYRIQRFIRTAASTISNEHAQEDIKKEVRQRVKDLLLLCSAIDSSNKIDIKTTMLDMMEQAFWIGRYAPAGPLAAFIESLNQSERAKGRRKKGAAEEGGWRAIARMLALEITAKGKGLSANGLADSVISAWNGQKPNHPSGKTMALFITELAKEPDCPFALNVDGRSKKVRK